MLFAAAPVLAVLTCYPEIPASMLTSVTSASGFSGQVFRFKTTATVDSNGTRVPAGTIGYGIVLSNIPASNRARNGAIVLSPRFLSLGRTQMQVAGDPRDASILTHGPNPVAEGAGAVPVPGVSLAIGEALHGTNITIGPGYNFHIVPVGNLLERGPCVEK
jgi:hypothetical protein